MKLISFSRDVRPDTSLPSVSHEELVIRVNVLAQECARLSRELNALREARSASAVSTVGPIPDSPANANSGRALIRLIATRVGRNEDSVRQSLARGKAFAELRSRVPDLCTNVAIMRWLAEGDRYSRIAAGASMSEVVGA